MKAKWVLALLVGVMIAALYVGNVLAKPSASRLTTTILAKSVFEAFDVKGQTHPDDWRTQIKTRGLSDVYVVDNKLAPGADTGWHSHPGPSLILVVAGTVTNYSGDDSSCTPHVYVAGSGFVDSGGGHVHILRNETGAPAETIAVQLLPKDATRRIDKLASGACHF